MDKKRPVRGAQAETPANFVQAALGAVEAIDQFKARHALLAQNLRIGLETGMVYVGHAGGGGHFVYSIVGDSANTAARPEASMFISSSLALRRRRRSVLIRRNAPDLTRF